jgi:superfamily I DNA/RNA helicase
MKVNTTKNKLVQLDPEQKAALDYKGSCFLVGPPGSGKTEVFEAKAEQCETTSAWLPFTRAACKELKDRLPSKEKITLGRSIATIHSFCQAHLEDWPGSYQSQLEDFLELEDIPTYGLVGIDEAQDLRPNHWRVIQSIMDSDTVFFGGADPYQTIFTFGDAMGTKIVEEFKRKGYKEFQFHNSYRSSPEITQLLDKIYPRELVGRGPKTYNRSAIFTRTHFELDTLSDLLKENKIPHTKRNRLGKDKIVIEESPLYLMVTHACKGLGFDNVYQLDWPPPNTSDEFRMEKNLLYVSVARASKKFTLIDSWNFTLARNILGASCESIHHNELVRLLKNGLYS